MESLFGQFRIVLYINGLIAVYRHYRTVILASENFFDMVAAQGIVGVQRKQKYAAHG